MRIDSVDPDTASAAELDAWHEFCRATDGFDFPGEPGPPRSATVGGMFSDDARRLTWFARSDDQDAELLGGATLSLEGNENAHHAECEIRVRPDVRRSGIGRALFERAQAAAIEDRRTEFDLWARFATPGSAFAAALGARPALHEVRRVLRTAEVDSDSVAALAGGAASRVDGFDLVRWVDHCPDEWLEAYAAAKDGMNDAPMGEVDWRPVTSTGERVRVWEGSSLRRGLRRYSVAVRERSTGAVAGITEMFVSPDSPRASQGMTTVLGPYRGRGFGLWLKADMVRWLSEAEPGVTEHETWNAAVNTHMIAVNERLGYRVMDTWLTWQLALG